MRIILLFIIVLHIAYGSVTRVTGTAFKDYNADGIQQDAEFGVEGIVVKVYDSSDNKVAETVTDVNGSHNLDVTDFPIRLEDNPYAFTSIQANVDPLSANGDENDTGEVAGIVKFHMNDSGIPKSSGSPNANSDAPNWIELVKLKQVGSTHGIAFSRYAQKIFISAFLKRHVGLGPLGGGGIYIVDPDENSTENSNVSFLDLDEIGIATSDEDGIYVSNVQDDEIKRG